MIVESDQKKYSSKSINIESITFFDSLDNSSSAHNSNLGMVSVIIGATFDLEHNK